MAWLQSLLVINIGNKVLEELAKNMDLLVLVPLYSSLYCN